MDQKETFDWMRSELDRLRAENARLKAPVGQFVQFVCGFGCKECEKGVPVLKNSAGKWSHREEGNCCNNTSIYEAYERWLSHRERAK